MVFWVKVVVIRVSLWCDPWWVCGDGEEYNFC